MAQILGQPVLLVIPKIVNVIAGCFVRGVLLLRWLPLAVKECGQSEQHASDLETLAAIDWLTGLYNRRHFEVHAQAELARLRMKAVDPENRILGTIRAKPRLWLRERNSSSRSIRCRNLS
jgi:predicted signal transduction protein with EAL and GGDEF domain